MNIIERLGALQRLIDANVQLKAKPEGLERLQREIEDGLRALQQEQTEERGDGLPEPTDAEIEEKRCDMCGDVDVCEHHNGDAFCKHCSALLPAKKTADEPPLIEDAPTDGSRVLELMEPTCGDCLNFLDRNDTCLVSGEITSALTPVSRASSVATTCRHFSRRDFAAKDPQLRSALREYLEARNRLTELELAVTDQKKLLADLEGQLRGMV